MITFLCSAFKRERKFEATIVTASQFSRYSTMLSLFLNLMMQRWQQKMRLPWKASHFYSSLTSKGSSWGSCASNAWLSFPDIYRGEIPPAWLWTCSVLQLLASLSFTSTIPLKHETQPLVLRTTIELPKLFSFSGPSLATLISWYFLIRAFSSKSVSGVFSYPLYACS